MFTIKIILNIHSLVFQRIDQHCFYLTRSRFVRYVDHRSVKRVTVGFVAVTVLFQALADTLSFADIQYVW